MLCCVGLGLIAAACTHPARTHPLPPPCRAVQGDVRDKAALDELFAAEKFDAVIHFAGLKAVGESVEIPLEYYDNNIVSTLVLLEVMKKHNCFNVRGQGREVPGKQPGVQPSQPAQLLVHDPVVLPGSGRSLATVRPHSLCFDAVL